MEFIFKYILKWKTSLKGKNIRLKLTVAMPPLQETSVSGQMSVSDLKLAGRISLDKWVSEHL